MRDHSDSGKSEPFSLLEKRSFMFHFQVQRRETLLFFPFCCCWQGSVRLQLAYKTHWAKFLKSFYTLHVLDFSCIAAALGGGRVFGVEGRVGTDGLFTFATSLRM